MSKADRLSLTRYYEFMSQIVDYDSADLGSAPTTAKALSRLETSRMCHRLGPRAAIVCSASIFLTASN